MLARIADRIEMAIEFLARIKTIVAALAAATIVLLLIVSSTQRYIFGRPIAVTEELGSLLFVIVAFMAASESFLTNRQIRTEVIWQLLSERWRGAALIAGHLGSAAVLAIFAWKTWQFAFFSFELGSRSLLTEILLWPFMMVIPVSLATLVVAIIARSINDILALRTGKPMRSRLPPNEDLTVQR
jgi:TRAP-type C4-dicarboxylate transport system permease small subunit